MELFLQCCIVEVDTNFSYMAEICCVGNGVLLYWRN